MTDRNKSILFLCCLVAFMYYCNSMAPLFADDYGYAFSWKTGERISGFVDVLNSQYVHWLTWGGRSVAHIFAQMFIYWGKPVFNVVNTAVYVLFVMLLCWFYYGQRPTFNFRFSSLFLSAFFLWSGVRVFGENVFWLIGACNYLWTMFLILLFLYPYRLALEKSEGFQGGFFRIGMLFLGILAGWTNENAATVMLILVGLAILYFYRIKQLQGWMVLGILGAMLGFALMIMAPGNFARAADFHPDFGHQLWRPIRLCLVMFAMQIFMWGTVFFARYYMKRDGLLRVQNLFWNRYAFIGDFWGQRKVRFWVAALFIAAGIAVNLVMVASPIFPYRAAFSSTGYMIVGALGAADFVQSYPGIQWKHWVRVSIWSAAVAFFVVTMGWTAQRYTILHRESLERQDYIAEEKAKGHFDLEVKPFSVKNDEVLFHVFVRDVDEEKFGLEHYFEVHSLCLRKQ